MKTENKISSTEIAMIILAAGSSERMGQIKQLLPWKQTTLLGNAIEQTLNAGISDIYVILGSDRNAIENSIKRYNITVIYNSDWKKGMGTSVSAAMKTILQNKEYKAIIFSLADQPLITSADLYILINNFKTSDKGIVSTKMNSHSGVPAIFDKKYFNELKELKGDHGARFIISNNQKDNFSVNLEDHYIDVDTIETYNSLVSKHQDFYK